MKQAIALSLLLSASLGTSLAGAQGTGPAPGDSSQPAPPAEAPPAPPSEPPAETPAPPPGAEPPVAEKPAAPANEDGMGESYGEPDPTGSGPDGAGDEASSFPFKRKGQVIFGLEHVAGIYSATTTTKTTSPDPFLSPSTAVEEEDSAIRISLFGEGGGAFLAPKLGIDVVLAPPLTLGGSIYFSTITTKSETKAGTQTFTSPDRDASGFGFNPRLGVALGEKPMVWLRGGIAYASASRSDSDPTDDFNTEIDVSFTALSVEATLGFVSSAGFGVGFGPAFYIPLSSTVEIGGVEPPGVESSSFSWLIAGTGYFAP